MNNRAKQQQEFIDDETFNFLVELKAVNFGTCETLVSIASKDSKLS